VVEHSIGNGEVDSSILSGSTIHPVEIRDDGKEYSTAVGMRSARIDTDWNRSNCRTHRSCCCQRHRLRHRPPPHRVRIRDNTLGLPGSKSTGEDGRQALVRQQQWFHLLAQEFGLTGQSPLNRSSEKSGGEAGGLHRPYPSDGGGLSPSKGAAGGSEPSDPCGPPTEACWLLMPTRI
jgi:hypothetical protein